MTVLIRCHCPCVMCGQWVGLRSDWPVGVVGGGGEGGGGVGAGGCMVPSRVRLSGGQIKVGDESQQWGGSRWLGNSSPA